MVFFILIFQKLDLGDFRTGLFVFYNSMAFAPDFERILALYYRLQILGFEIKGNKLRILPFFGQNGLQVIFNIFIVHYRALWFKYRIAQNRRNLQWFSHIVLYRLILAMIKYFYSQIETYHNQKLLSFEDTINLWNVDAQLLKIRNQRFDGSLSCADVGLQFSGWCLTFWFSGNYGCDFFSDSFIWFETITHSKILL